MARADTTVDGRDVSADPRWQSPIALADLAIATVVSGRSETVHIEPAADGRNHVMTFDRGLEVLATVDLDDAIAAATIARLAFIARLDLATRFVIGGVVRGLIGNDAADVVLTIRSGNTLRCELGCLPSARVSPTAAIQPEVVLAAGDMIGTYRVREQLGQGGMGTVYRVEHSVLGSVRALKVLRGDLFEGTNASHRFVREARAAARVVHPNIIQVFDFGYLADGRPYFVMEMLDGESLLDLIQRGALMPTDAVAIARQLASALGAAHDAGVVHADVTPANAWVVSMKPVTVKLLDFGLAEIIGEQTLIEGKGFAFGTPSYISPEQLRGLPPTDRSDQYGLGCTLFEMLSGHPPYVDPLDLRALCLKHINAPIPEVMSKFGPLPENLVDLVTTTLQKVPLQRFPGMRAMIAALDEVAIATDRSGWRRFLPG